MRALITGISGFVGSHLAEHLRACGDAVLGTITSSPSTADAPTVAWNIAEEPNAATRRQIESFAPDVIFHLAALSILRDCGDAEPTPQAIAVNVDGVRHVLDLAGSLPRRPRIVFTSSSHVYRPVDPANPQVAESSPVEPRSAYGKTKWAAEQLCREAVCDSGLDVVVVRSFAQSGPGMDSRLMLAEWAAQFARGGEQPIDVASLDVTIDFLDVRDAVRALRLLAMQGVAGETYNLGSGVPRTTGEIFALLRRAAGVDRGVRELRPGRRSDPIADVARLQSLTGWRPEIAPEQTVADVLEDWRRRIAADSATS